MEKQHLGNTVSDNENLNNFYKKSISGYFNTFQKYFRWYNNSTSIQFKNIQYIQIK